LKGARVADLAQSICGRADTALKSSDQRFHCASITNVPKRKRGLVNDLWIFVFKRGNKIVDGMRITHSAQSDHGPAACASVLMFECRNERIDNTSVTLLRQDLHGSAALLPPPVRQRLHYELATPVIIEFAQRCGQSRALKRGWEWFVRHIDNRLDCATTTDFAERLRCILTLPLVFFSFLAEYLYKRLDRTRIAQITERTCRIPGLLAQ
jgi:hypothetical protein